MKNKVNIVHSLLIVIIILFMGCHNVVKDEVQKSSKSNFGARIVKEAKKYLDIPYQYGGTGNPGFDCSGFVMTVFAKCGVKLPRMVKDQMKYGVKINRGEESPGDLIFFSVKKFGKVGHVGIVTGNGKMIHSNSTGGSVRISKYVGNSYWESHFKTIKRIKE
ncbi:C40 family peptidase [bacterium]|nr:C40 family peptidase [bacterium]